MQRRASGSPASAHATEEADMANYSGTSGNDVLQGFADGDFFFGSSGNDTLIGTTVASGVGNAKSQNVVVYEGLTGPVSIDMTAGTVSKGADGSDVISGIAQARGTNSSDSFTGDGDRNWFWGNGGNDTFDGLGTGDDNDRINYTYDPAGVQVNLTTGIALDGFGGTDTIIEIEHVHGSLFNDHLIGDSGNNVLVGLKGNDTFDGGSVGDLNTFTGLDIVDYRFAEFAPVVGTRGVDIDLAAGTGIDPYGDTDTFTRIEGIVGTQFGDTIRGSSGENQLIGMQGNDILDGGEGTDQVSYFRDVAGVRVNNAGGYAIDGWGTKDVLSSFEQVQATDFADTIMASGEQFINGGSGDDMIVFGSARAAYTVTITGTSFSMTGAADAVSGGFDVEKLFFTDGVLDVATNTFDSSQTALRPLDLTGGDTADALNGGSGADYIVANAGGDVVVAGDGNDMVYGNKDLDTLSGGAGNDTANDFSFAEGDRITGIAFASASVTGGVSGAIVSDGTNALTLIGVDAGQVGADWFS
jgi:Ca2+-binding RTX toxin-like protein